MARLMRCLYCGALQDEPKGVKACVRCGGELAFEVEPPPSARRSYVQVQMELDQVQAPAERNVDRYLLVTVRTPVQVPPEEAAPTKAGRPSLSFVAVLDVSGSMRGAKLTQAKEAVRQALVRLHDGDVFSLVIFDNEVRCVFEPATLDAQVRRTVDSALGEIEAGGMTALCGGLELGLEKSAARQQDTNLVLLLSDGQANVGETDVEQVGLRGSQARQRGIMVSTLGAGDDYNEALMVEIATQGAGRFYHVQSAGQIGAYLTGELGEVAALAARDARLQLAIPPAAAVVPLSAAYPAQQSAGQAEVQVGDVPSDTELEIPLLNRVTVRFVEQKVFSLREGVVAPVVEEVLRQMRAANVLGVSRAMARGVPEGARRVDREAVALRDYAALLGEERAREEEQRLRDELQAMQATPSIAKAAAFAAFAVQRGTKKFK